MIHINFNKETFSVVRNQGTILSSDEMISAINTFILTALNNNDQVRIFKALFEMNELNR